MVLSMKKIPHKNSYVIIQVYGKIRKKLPAKKNKHHISKHNIQNNYNQNNLIGPYKKIITIFQKNLFLVTYQNIIVIFKLKYFL